VLKGSYLSAVFSGFSIVVLVYFLSRGVTLYTVVPIQSYFLPEITTFAALVYLPHGVRVLAPWLLGWAAIPALMMGALLSHVVLNPDELKSTLGITVVLSIITSECSGLIGIWCVALWRGIKRTSDFGKLGWRGLLVAAFVASVFNSVGLALVYSGRLPDNVALTLGVYAIGDVVGFMCCLICLMLVFRALRRGGLFRKAG